MKQLIKQLLFYFLSLISISLPQTLSSYSYAKIKFNFFDYSNKSILEQIRRGSSSSIRSARTYSILFRAPTECFQEALKNEKPAKIFERYWLYEFPGFIEFIKTLSGYEEHIQEIHKKLSDRGKFIDFWAKLLVANSPSNVCEVIQQMANELAQKKRIKKSNNRSIQTDHNQTSPSKLTKETTTTLSASKPVVHNQTERISKKDEQINLTHNAAGIIKLAGIDQEKFEQFNGSKEQNELHRQMYTYADKYGQKILAIYTMHGNIARAIGR